MTKLTIEELAFLDKHSIPLSRVFDASGMKKSDYHAVMSELEFFVATGTAPCTKGGHTMKLRSGHCAQCNPAGIAFLKRHSEPGEVYVASSKSDGIVKVGTSKDAKARIAVLNHQGYGEFDDWTLNYSCYCKYAGKVEHRVHLHLRKYQEIRNYMFMGSYKTCLELFACDVQEAIVAVQVASKHEAQLSG